jgi:hypothetical protein
MAVNRNAHDVGETPRGHEVVLGGNDSVIERDPHHITVRRAR